MVFDAQLMSVKEFKVSGGLSPRLELLPLTQRYAALTTSLLLLNVDYEVCTCTCPPAHSVAFVTQLMFPGGYISNKSS